MTESETIAEVTQDILVAQAKQHVIDTVKAAVEGGVIAPQELYAAMCAMTVPGETAPIGATQAQRDAVANYHSINDECEIDDECWHSPGDNGYWVHAWLWVGTDQEPTRCMTCNTVIPEYDADYHCENCRAPFSAAKDSAP
jgi:hypothetical protein